MILAPTWLEVAQAYAQWQTLAPQERRQPLRLTRGQGFVPPNAPVLVLGQDEWYLTLQPTDGRSSTAGTHRHSR